jgi:hypothetical protein
MSSPQHLPRIALAVLVAAAGGCTGQPPGEPVFCYAWLTDVTCYREPVPASAARLVGGYYRDPDDPTSRGYWLDRAQEAPMSR